jgi:protein phosphatase
MIRYLGDFAKRGYIHHEDWREAFGRSFLKLCNEVEALMKDEPRHPSIRSPCYVFGDLHGNMRDLMYFGENIINFQDFRFTPYNLLFLGDYVDRGEHSIEVVAYLFALKVLAPKQVTLLRGNHEDTLVNGDTRTYGETSLKGECIALFSNVLGTEVWQRANEIFTWLPLSANIDGRIFCTHGGLPRYSGGRDDRLELLKSPFFPRMQSFFAIPADEDEVHAKFRQLASDVCWSDPAEDDRMTNEYGFGNNPRGQGVILFGNKAVDTFLDNFGFEYIFRAHQEKSDGLKLSKNARVMTIFSTSAYVGHSNGAGVVFVNNGKIRLIIKQPDD